MNVNLPIEVNDFVESLVSQGRFDSEEAVVVEGVRLLMSRETLRGEIQKGVSQLDRGEWHDEENVFNEIDAEIDKLESTQQGSWFYAETSVFNSIEKRFEADRTIHRAGQTDSRAQLVIFFKCTGVFVDIVRVIRGDRDPQSL